MFCLRVQGKGSLWLQFECLRGLEFVLGDVCKKKSFREGEERLSDSMVQFSVSVSVWKRGKGVVLRKFGLNMQE
jgi:hypothetical protein